MNALSTRLLLEVDRDGQHWEAEFEKGGKVKRRSPQPARRPRTAATGEPRTGTTVTFWPDATVFDETEFRAQTIVERMQIMAFLNKGLEIRFVDERTDPVTKTTYKYNGGIVDFVKHLNASKESLFRKVAVVRPGRGGSRGRDRAAVERGLPRVHPLLRQRHLDHRGRDARRGVLQVADQRGQPLRPRPQPLEGEGGEPQGRGHPRGADGHHLGPPARPAVRGADQGQARATPPSGRSRSARRTRS